ncbi:ORF6N domain-containing protein [Chryseolinea sp. T2]|uniref:ORF6N domain-containing protein n=1 Tax=Chryseolinea sp. T2 TaxID=3129255 RepID=UPI003076B820
MAKDKSLPDEIIVSKIYVVRGHKVMIDRDLSTLYGVETRVLKQAVRRNAERFPSDFMFEMTAKELKKWSKDNITSQNDLIGLRHAPFCFTEQGVTMLSCVLSSKRAVEMNIRIIRIFTRMREMMLTHKDILLKLEKMEKQVLQHDEDVKVIFDYMKELLDPEAGPMRKIGFKRKGEE